VNSTTKTTCNHLTREELGRIARVKNKTKKSVFMKIWQREKTNAKQAILPNSRNEILFEWKAGRLKGPAFVLL